MTKYLLPSWKKAIDKKIDEECRKFINELKPINHERTAWFHVWHWFQEEVRSGEILPELEPFAFAYCKAAVTSTLNGYAHYRIV